jgi:hypothetical protein
LVAAPEAPAIRPPLSARAASINDRSRSGSRLKDPSVAGLYDSRFELRFNHFSSTENISPSETMTALSTTF